MHAFLFLELSLMLAASLLVGNELAVALFVHPTFSGLPDREHAAAAKPFAALLGRVTPFWYALVLILLIAATWVSFASNLLTKAEYFGIATVLWLMTITFTLASLAPLNSCIAQWNLEALPANWRDQRNRWDSLHRVRVAVVSAALVSIFLGVVS